MEDLRTIALSALICDAGSQIGYKNVNLKQIEAALDFCKGKDVFVSRSTGYGKTLIFAVTFAVYLASAFSIRSDCEGAPPSSAARDASASVMSHLAIIPLISSFIAFYGKRLLA